MNKKFRQEQILKLIRSQEIHTQEDLARSLRRLSVRTTQVTLSRDIHELGLAKTPAGYRQIGEPEPPPEEQRLNQLRRLAGEFLRDVRQAQNLLVLKTDPGNAQALAVTLDAEGWPEVLGTVAGDDTILVITPNHKKAVVVKEKLLELIAK